MKLSKTQPEFSCEVSKTIRIILKSTIEDFRTIFAPLNNCPFFVAVNVKCVVLTRIEAQCKNPWTTLWTLPVLRFHTMSRVCSCSKQIQKLTVKGIVNYVNNLWRVSIRGVVVVDKLVIVIMMMTMMMITTTMITQDVDPSTANVTFKFQASFIPKLFFILLLTSIW